MPLHELRLSSDHARGRLRAIHLPRKLACRMPHAPCRIPHAPCPMPRPAGLARPPDSLKLRAEGHENLIRSIRPPSKSRPASTISRHTHTRHFIHLQPHCSRPNSALKNPTSPSASTALPGIPHRSHCPRLANPVASGTLPTPPPQTTHGHCHPSETDHRPPRPRSAQASRPAHQGLGRAHRATSSTRTTCATHTHTGPIRAADPASTQPSLSARPPADPG